MSEEKTSARREMLKAAGVLLAGTAVTGILSSGKAEAAKKAPRWAMVVDLRRCIGCRGCTVSCKSENGVPLGTWNTVVKTVEFGKYPDTVKQFLPKLCNHCEGKEKVGRMNVPPCVKECPEYPKPKRLKYRTPDGKTIRYNIGATYKRPDGAILYDNSLCIGCGKCIKACPYGARYFDPLVKLTRADREGDVGIGKCTFCAHRIDKGVVPSCVNTCQGRARIFGDLNDPDSEVSKLAKKFNLLKDRDMTTLQGSLEKKVETVPNVLYIDPDNLLRMYRVPAEENKKLQAFRDQFEH
jgi:tetrathionate reductase subunit B